MKLSGWIFMLGSWLLIIGVLSYCLSRIFSEKPQQPGNDKTGGQGD